MPRRCPVCAHPESHSIDEPLVTGAPYRSVAKRFGLSESAVYRHKTEHLPVHLLKARDIEEAARADDLLDQDRKSTRLNSSHANISYAVFCLKKKKSNITINHTINYVD